MAYLDHDDSPFLSLLHLINACNGLGFEENFYGVVDVPRLNKVSDIISDSTNHHSYEEFAYCFIATVRILYLERTITSEDVIEILLLKKFAKTCVEHAWSVVSILLCEFLHVLAKNEGKEVRTKIISALSEGKITEKTGFFSFRCRSKEKSDDYDFYSLAALADAKDKSWTAKFFLYDASLVPKNTKLYKLMDIKDFTDWTREYKVEDLKKRQRFEDDFASVHRRLYPI